MNVKGKVYKIGDIEHKGNDFKVAEIILDRRSMFQGKEYPNFTKVVLQGKRTELLSTSGLKVGAYIDVSGDLQGRFFDYLGETKFSQDFVVWDIKVEQSSAEPEGQKEDKTKSDGIYS